MDKELIISSTPTEVEIALLEDKTLVELHKQKTNNNFTVGDIFLGQIRKLMPSLNAGFIDIGYKKDGFLHYTDLGPKLKSLVKFTNQTIQKKNNTHLLDDFSIEPEIIKTGKIEQVLNRKQPIIVQILKEPISTKGPRLTCELTIPGRFVVLTPFQNTVSVSKKIANAEERKRLRRLIDSIRPKNFGVIVRTVAEGKKVADLHEEIIGLTEKWKQIHGQLKNAKPPQKILNELDKTYSILRDLLTADFKSIVVDDKDLATSIKNYMRKIAPEKVKIVQYYRSKRPIFDNFGITRHIKSSFGKTATMPSGAYLIVEHTEAMHVIDVNSGHKNSVGNQEDSALSVNMESAKEIARQLRLRDIGGIIIIDFIDMRNGDNRRKLVAEMRKRMKNDRAQHTILPLSKFGLMQITRQRVRPEIKVNTKTNYPSHERIGKLLDSDVLMEELERDLNFIMTNNGTAKVSLNVHPYVFAYLKRGFFGHQWKWFMKYKKWVSVKRVEDTLVTKYKFYDQNKEEIKLN